MESICFAKRRQNSVPHTQRDSKPYHTFQSRSFAQCSIQPLWLVDCIRLNREEERVRDMAVEYYIA